MTTLGRVIPILRIFDEQKAREFYVDFLGFKVDWEHRFEPRTPVFMQVSQGSAVFNLSEHFGDGTPGTSVRIEVNGLKEYQQLLLAKKFKYSRPGLQEQSWGTREMVISDPFANKLIFWEPLEKTAKP